jgi:ParB family chromosome partitioning protein
MSKNLIENATRNNLWLVDPDDLYIIGLDTDDGPDHPLYDPRHNQPVPESMIRNVMYHGVLEPVLVRKDGDDRLDVVAGRQRVRAAREANIRLVEQGKLPIKVAVIAKKGDSSKMMGIMISENEIRRDDSPLAKGRKAQRLIDFGSSLEEVAVVFGVDPKSISNWLKLLDCDDKVQQAVEAGQISDSAATKLASLPRAQQRETLDEMIASGDVTTKKATAVAKATKASKANPTEKAPTAADVIVAPGRKTLTRVIAAAAEGDTDLDPIVVATLKWVIGEAGPGVKGLKGLTKILNKIESEIEEREAAKLERDEKKEEREAAKLEREKQKAAKAAAKEAKAAAKAAKAAEREAKAAAKAAQQQAIPGTDAPAKTGGKGKGGKQAKKAPPSRPG